MEYGILIMKTAFLYLLILTIFRMMGKREIGELSVLDLVVFIMIAEMAVMSIEDPEKPMLYTLIPVAVIVAIQLIFAVLSLKNQTIRELIDGKPTVLINKGKIDEQAMKKQRYNLGDLLIQLREKDIKNVSDVEFAILEPSGKLSVFEKESNQVGGYKEFPFPLIMDGIIQEKQLERLDKTKTWLQKELNKQGFHQIESIFFCSMDNDGSLYIKEKSK